MVAKFIISAPKYPINDLGPKEVILGHPRLVALVDLEKVTNPMKT